MLEDVGIVGSPSTTRKITVDILEDASGRPLQGELVYLSHQLGEKCLIAVGTVTEIRTSNRWHEDANMRGVLKRHGSLPHLSGEGDVRTGEILIQAAYLAESSNPAEGEPPVESGGALSMSPTTGAPVERVTDGFLTELLRRHGDEIIYLGRIYRSDVRMPLTIRHFGSEREGGTGEAYHSGIFGKSGSGKSGLAAYLIAAQLRHPSLGIIVMDPQGQFTSERGLPFGLQGWAERQGREVQALSISQDIRLPKDTPLLTDLLGTTAFFRHLGVQASENQRYAADEFARTVARIDDWNDDPGDQVLRQAVTTLLADQPALTRIYASQSSRDRMVSTMNTVLNDSREFAGVSELFRPIHSLFMAQNMNGENRIHIWSVMQGLLDPERRPRPFLIIDFSRQGGTGGVADLLESSAVRARILRRVCSIMNQAAQNLFRQDRGLNVLVVFDEAQRFAAQEPENEATAQLAERLVDYVRTTRKFGLGWMFITQEVGSLRRGIYSQLRVKCFGYGLTSGSELQRVRQEVPDDSSLELYRSFVDPEAIRPKEFPFMLIGPVSPLSFTGAPLFLSVYTDFEQFLADNGRDEGGEDGADIGEALTE